VIGGVATLGAYDPTFVLDNGTLLAEVQTQAGNAANRTVSGGFRVEPAEGTYNITGTLT
jgi:hypothetical protein